jgi:GNAT superfamily N-acetyltransferase
VDGEGFFIDNVAVDPSHKGTGVGKALYTRIGYLEYDRRRHGGAHIVYLRKTLR